MFALPVPPILERFDELLDASVQLKVAGLLASLPEKEFTGREIAGLLGVSHSNVQEALRSLTDLGFASIRRIGRANVVTVNEEHVAFRPLRALYEVRRGLAAQVAEDLRAGFRESALSLTVFGSYARGEADRRSDLDLLVVARHLDRARVATRRLEAAFERKYGVHLSTQVVSRADLRRRPVPPYLEAAEREGVPILGVPLRRLMARGG